MGQRYKIGLKLCSLDDTSAQLQSSECWWISAYLNPPETKAVCHWEENEEGREPHSGRVATCSCEFGKLALSIW